MVTFRPDGYIPPPASRPAPPVPAGPAWVHEIEHDGYRLQVRRDGDAVRPFTRRGSHGFRRDLVHQPDDGAAQFCIFDAGEGPY